MLCKRASLSADEVNDEIFKPAFFSEWVDSKPENPLFYGHLFFRGVQPSDRNSLKRFVELDIFKGTRGSLAQNVGNAMYKKSLQAAIDGQAKAREKLREIRTDMTGAE